MKIKVVSLPFNLDEHCLRNAFAKYGTVKSVKVLGVHNPGRCNGYAIIDMPDEKQANAAIKELNGGQVNGRTIVIGQPERSF